MLVVTTAIQQFSLLFTLLVIVNPPRSVSSDSTHVGDPTALHATRKSYAYIAEGPGPAQYTQCLSSSCLDSIVGSGRIFRKRLVLPHPAAAARRDNVKLVRILNIDTIPASLLDANTGPQFSVHLEVKVRPV